MLSRNFVVKGARCHSTDQWVSKDRVSVGQCAGQCANTDRMSSRRVACWDGAERSHRISRAFYHVMARGNCRQAICKDDEDRPSTHLSLHYHLIFSIKEREPWLSLTPRIRVYEYLDGVIWGLNGVPHAVGGTGDHENTRPCRGSLRSSLVSWANGWRTRAILQKSQNWRKP